MLKQAHQKNFRILGPGCTKCIKTEEVVRTALKAAGVEAKVEMVSDVQSMLKYNVKMTPTLMVDGQIRIRGRVPTSDEVKRIIAE